MFVVFTPVITDFAIPKITAGNYSVLALDIYKQVVGQQNFEMGAVVGMILLVPAIVTFVADRLVQRRQMATLTPDAVPFQPKPNKRFDTAMLVYCIFIGLVFDRTRIDVHDRLVSHYGEQRRAHLEPEEFGFLPDAHTYYDLPPVPPSPVKAASDGRRRLTSSISTSKSAEVRAIAFAVRRNSGTFGVRWM